MPLACIRSGRIPSSPSNMTLAVRLGRRALYLARKFPYVLLRDFVRKVSGFSFLRLLRWSHGFCLLYSSDVSCELIFKLFIYRFYFCSLWAVVSLPQAQESWWAGLAAAWGS